MTLEEKRIKIAEACGWSRVWRDADYDWRYPGGYANTLPDYFSDLNAMYEAEKVLTPDQEVSYVEWLAGFIMSDVYSDNDLRYQKGKLCSNDAVYRAAAAQRAEAFGLTLKLWT